MDKERERQLAEVEKNIHRKPVTLDTSNNVVMANRMILHAACSLTLDEIKLLRFIIMQTEKDDTELYEYELTLKDFAKVLGVNIKSHGLYKMMDKLTDDLVDERISIYNGKNFDKFHWLHRIRYTDGKLYIKLHEDLKPYLLNLRGSFTKYELDEIIKLNSVYAIRIYEVIRSYMNDNDLPFAGKQNEISISMDVLRQITNTEKKFERPYDFKRKVIDVAVREINRCSKYHITAEPYKNGKAIAGFDFLIESQAGFVMRQQAADTDEIEGQMKLNLQGMA